MFQRKKRTRIYSITQKFNIDSVLIPLGPLSGIEMLSWTKCAGAKTLFLIALHIRDVCIITFPQISDTALSEVFVQWFGSFKGKIY